VNAPIPPKRDGKKFVWEKHFDHMEAPSLDAFVDPKERLEAEKREKVAKSILGSPRTFTSAEYKILCAWKQ